MLALFALLSSITAAVVAEASLSSSCSAFSGAGVFDTANNFTLSAVPLGGGTSVPLLVNAVAAVPMASWLILSEIPGGSSAWPILNLHSGFLSPVNPNVPQQVSMSLFVPDGTSPSFLLSQSIPNPAAVYCGVPTTTGPPLLALNGHTDLFSLCSNHTSIGVRTDLVYNAPANTCVGCLTDCSAVEVQINLNGQ